MMTRDELAIVRTVIYASLFDYPLTLDQLHRSLISSRLTPDEIVSIYDGSARLRTIVGDRDGFFFPAGRFDLVAERRRRESRSRAFLARHARLLRWICLLPFTRMIALSGSVAHLNLEEGGDLDLFIVTRGRHVWTVTVAMILLTRLLGVRRVVCANFVMSDAHLVLEQQDLFTANQILHLRPLIGGEVFEGFVAANPFVKKIYPNCPGAAPSGFAVPLTGVSRRLKRALEAALSVPSPVIEIVCRRAYAWHLRRRAGGWRSPEQVRLRPDYLKLHTQSHRRSVLERFDERVEAALGRGERAAIA
jgi:hypothetical protein